MAELNDVNASASGIFAAVKGALGLFTDVNKTPTAGDQSVTPADEYESKFSEEKIKMLTLDWRKSYAVYYADIKNTQDTAYSYWIGKQNQSVTDDLEGVKIVDNRIFSALETFLPIATRANPDPLVASDDSPEGQKLAKDVKKALVNLADRLKLRMKLKGMVRDWAISRIGAIRIDYDYVKDEIDLVKVNPKRFLFDPNGHIDESGFFVGQWMGERMPFVASTLEEMFPLKKSEIVAKAKDKRGTRLEVIKWLYKGTDTFYTLDNVVLAKKKNPHWNWDGEVTRKDPDTGAEITEEIQGTNHFKLPMYNYVFLSIFSTGLQPHDETSLILQNVTIQDQLNKRYKQLDKNVDSQNNGIVVDGRLMKQDQAAEAASALRRGGAIRVMGNVNEAFKRDAAPNVGKDIWGVIQDSRTEIDGIFGITGSTAQGLEKQDSVRGKILANQQDSSRIGGGITEYIEQAADSIYNWMVQMMVVHYDNEHYFNILGQQTGEELLALTSSRFRNPLTVTVKEGSLIPKDPLTKRNEAIDLWSAQAIDPITLYSRLEDPDPIERAKQLILWQQIQKGDLQAIAQYIPNFAPTDQQQIEGGSPVNALPDGQNVEPTQNEGQPPPEQVQSKELLQAVPIK